jgi:hypothetical protein
LIGGVAGFAGGYLVGYNEVAGEPLSISPLSAWIAVLMIGAAFVIGSWIYFREVDEVDLVDNLWGSTVGFYVYSILFGGWIALDFLDAAPTVNHIAIFWVTLAAASGAYLYRKWRAR